MPIENEWLSANLEIDSSEPGRPFVRSNDEGSHQDNHERGHCRPWDPHLESEETLLK